MKILVTGAAGFIGFHLVVKLLSRGAEVVGLDNINDYYDQKLKFARLYEKGIYKDDIKYGALVQSRKHSKYSFIKLNLEDKEQIDLIFKINSFDIVINLAAQAGVRYSIKNPYAYLNSNLIGFLNVLEACRNYPINHLYYASSSSVYGKNEKIPYSEKDNVDNPVSLYAATKKANELLATSYHNLYNISCTGLRFFTVYGPWGRPDMAYFMFTKAILEGEPIKVFNNGNSMRDFTFVDDVINSLDQLITADKGDDKTCNRILNIGNNSPEKLLDFISILEKILNKKAEKEFYPMQPGDVIKTYANIDELIKIINYKPKIELSKGLKYFVDWYKNYYHY
tara:strand:- start:637 stop:1650 length:1014 start_codon:yes stop_codon:yes gene_type:complete